MVAIIIIFTNIYNNILQYKETITMKTSPIIIEEIRRLSQEEGLNDVEIADIIKYNRVSIQRIRKDNGIPKCNRNMRKDKKEICPACGRTYYIKRIQKTSFCCPDCARKIDSNINNQ